MNAITVFNWQGKKIRQLGTAERPLFVATDVCAVLGLNEVHKALRRVDGDDRNSIPVIDALGRSQLTSVVNESGLYALILSSKKPEARAFKRWVTTEVLPTIRKTGGYLMQKPAMSYPESLRRLADAVERGDKTMEALSIIAPRRAFGSISELTGQPRTRLVPAYFRSGLNPDGTTRQYLELQTEFAGWVEIAS